MFNCSNAVMYQFQSMCKQHNMIMHTKINGGTTFQEDWTTLKNRLSWRHGGHLRFFQKWKQHFITQDIQMYLHNQFRQYLTIFDKERILAGNSFYVWRHSRHFESRSVSNLKRESLQAKLKLMVKTPCLLTRIISVVKFRSLWSLH